MSDTDRKNTAKPHKKFYKKWWFWVIIILALIAFSPKDSPKPVVDAKSKASTSETSNSTVANYNSDNLDTKEEKPSVPAEYKSALSKATSYSNTMHMSKQGVYDQLVSDYGEKFTAVAAQYAIDNIKADWNANALAKAKEYQTTMSMSPAAIHDQLTSSYGEKFTVAEADYAIQHLND